MLVFASHDRWRQAATFFIKSRPHILKRRRPTTTSAVFPFLKTMFFLLLFAFIPQIYPSPTFTILWHAWWVGPVHLPYFMNPENQWPILYNYYIFPLPLQTQLHSEYNGPALGPKMSTENKRNFSNCSNYFLRNITKRYYVVLLQWHKDE